MQLGDSRRRFVLDRFRKLSSYFVVGLYEVRNDQSVREGVDYDRNHSPVSETKECGLFCCFRKTSNAGTQQFLANEVSDIVENRLTILVGLGRNRRACVQDNTPSSSGFTAQRSPAA